MARYKFGGTLFDFVDSSTKIQNIDVLAPTAATVSLWTDKTGGTQITDLQDSSGSPITTVSVQSDGNIPDFFGPDGVTSMYASADGGPRLAIVSWHAAADAVSSAEAAANSASSSETSAASSATAAQTAAQQAQAPTDSMVANLLQTPSSATATAANSAFAKKLSGLSTQAHVLPIAVPSEQLAWRANQAYNFLQPMCIGVDGLMYGTYPNNQQVIRSDGDPTVNARVNGPTTGTLAVPSVRWVTRTTAGYVMLTANTGSDLSNIYFCPNSKGFSTTITDWAMVQATRNIATISIAQPVVVGGSTWLVMGEYEATTPSIARALWLSTDGGQTWTTIKTSQIIDNTINSHWHNSLITPNGRIWASQGDGKNAWFGYTDDKGASWVPVKLPTTSPLYDGTSVFQQPTQLMLLDGTLYGTPDRGPFASGVWAIDPESGFAESRFALPSGELTDGQYGTASYSRGSKEAYVGFSDTGSGSAKFYVAGTGDGGRSWHLLSSVDTTGGTSNGFLVGPDRDGNLYFTPGPTIPTYGKAIMVAKAPTWTWQTPS